jgi:class 3 adenylate cyclase
MVVQIHTFMFADLCGYTEYTVRYGDERSAELAVGFHRLVAAIAAEESGELVKASGDGAMLRIDDCRRAITVAVRIKASCALLGYPLVRIGIDTGPAVSRSGDWYGTTVNTAARLADAAAPGEMLMTERARMALGVDERGPAEGVETVRRGRRRLKGLPACIVHAAVAA